MSDCIEKAIGRIPFRMAFAGGWIDQPFISRLNPTPPGSMVVVGVEPEFPWMERAGIASGTRKIANRIWERKLPDRSPAELVRELYAKENQGLSEPSGSQDMIGLVYPGVNRLDYDASHEGGIFPQHIESNNDPAVAAWLERVINILPVSQRPVGYNPLGVKNLDAKWVQKLGQTGKDCYDAILGKDARALGRSFNTCMECWATLLPQTVCHPTIPWDLVGLMKCYQERYWGAMYSGCGGGYLYIVSEDPVPGTFKVKVRIEPVRSGR